MGLFDNIKKAVRENLPESTINAIENKIGIDIDGRDNEKEVTNVADTATSVLQNASFVPTTFNNSYEVRNTIYDYDYDDNEYEIEQVFLMHNDYKEIDSGAAEIDCAFVFSTSEEADYDTNKPCICIGDSYETEVIDKYNKTGKIEDGTVLIKLENSIAEYRTERINRSKFIVAYHFYRGVRKDCYSQIYVEMPVFLKNSVQGNEAIKVVEQIVSTYKEEIKTV